MPIANCFITPDNPHIPENPVKLWSELSGVSSKHMTMNVITTHDQFGAHYDVMANLLLPSIWSREKISILQVTLAQALAQCFSLDINQIHITTTIVDSGMVVENGEEVHW